MQKVDPASYSSGKRGLFRVADGLEPATRRVAVS